MVTRGTGSVGDRPDDGRSEPTRMGGRRLGRFVFGVVLATVLSLAMAACQGGGASGGGGGGGVPKDGGTITIGVDATSSNTTIDPTS